MLSKDKTVFSYHLVSMTSNLHAEYFVFINQTKNILFMNALFFMKMSRNYGISALKGLSPLKLDYTTNKYVALVYRPLPDKAKSTKSRKIQKCKIYSKIAILLSPYDLVGVFKNESPIQSIDKTAN